VSLTFTAVNAAKVVTIACPGSGRKVAAGKGVELGSATGSAVIRTHTSYFGTIKGHETTDAALVPFPSAFAGGEPNDPTAIAAGPPNEILACGPFPADNGTELTLPPQGAAATGAPNSLFFATRDGDDTVLSAGVFHSFFPDSGYTEREVLVDAYGGSDGPSLFSFSPTLSTATTKAMGQFLSGSIADHETVTCTKSTRGTWGPTTGGITAKYAVGGPVTYGGSGTTGSLSEFRSSDC
jgi:hypothetical protein